MSEKKLCYKCQIHYPIDTLKLVRGTDGRRRWCCARCIARSKPAGFPGRVVP
jgi:hypothetical protein